MGLAIATQIAFFSDTTDQSSYTFTSFTPSANSLLVAMVAVQNVINTGTLGESHLTWTLRANTDTLANRGLSLWTANVDGSPGAISLVKTFTSFPTACFASIWEITGHDTANPIRQTKTAPSTVSTNPSLTFASALLTDNLYIMGVLTSRTAPAYTPPTSWTETCDSGAEFMGLCNAYRVNGETGTTYSMTGTSTTWSAIGVEINADPGASAYPRRGVISAQA